MQQSNQIAGILGIGTALPPYKLDQAGTASRLVEALGDNQDSARWAKRIFRQVGVETRYTCEPNLLADASECRYMPYKSGEAAPSTEERMAIYKRESVPLGLAAARRALEVANIDASSVTHLITVSCTGQFLPGMDTALVTQLQLQRNITRIPLTFIGCAAGLKAICLSKQLISSDPEAVVLIVCVELCTLHIQPTSDRDSLFGAAFFGDGASACVVGTVSTHERPVLQLGDTHSVLLPAGEEEMVWEVGNYGFDLYLSTNIPKLIGEWIPAEIERLCANEKTELWAIHPGGRGIVEALQQKYSLKDEQVAPSLDVLREIGNVSSATILFVLEQMTQRLVAEASQGASGIALAFGPGLTAEMVNITYIPAVASKEPFAYELYV